MSVKYNSDVVWSAGKEVGQTVLGTYHIGEEALTNALGVLKTGYYSVIDYTKTVIYNGIPTIDAAVQLVESHLLNKLKQAVIVVEDSNLIDIESLTD